MVQSNTGKGKEKRTKDAAEPEEIIPLRKRLIAELIGTFALVFAAVGSDVADVISGHEIGKFAIAAAPGLVVAATTYALDKMANQRDFLVVLCLLRRGSESLENITRGQNQLKDQHSKKLKIMKCIFEITREPYGHLEGHA